MNIDGDGACAFELHLGPGAWAHAVQAQRSAVAAGEPSENEKKKDQRRAMCGGLGREVAKQRGALCAARCPMPKGRAVSMMYLYVTLP